MTLVVELLTFLWMVVCGIVMGLAFDLLREMKVVWRLPGHLQPVMDICFWLASFILVFKSLEVINDGVVRFPVFIALLLGALCYFSFFSRRMRWVLSKLLSGIKWLIRKWVQLLAVLFWRPIDWFGRGLLHGLTSFFLGFVALLSWLFGKVYQFCMTLLQWCFQLLKKRGPDK